METVFAVLAALDLELVLRPRTQASPDDIASSSDAPRTRHRFAPRVAQRPPGGGAPAGARRGHRLPLSRGLARVEHALPVSLSLPLREDRFAGNSVVAVFDNMLPDDAAIRTRIATRTGGRGCRPIPAARRRRARLRRCAPVPAGGRSPGARGAIASRPLSDGAVADLLRNLSNAPLGLSEDEDFRISIAGAQEKTALLFHRRRFCLPLGTTATTHILKPQIGKLRSGVDLSRSVENEYFCMQLIQALGMPVARTEIRDFDGERALVVERFDRIWDGRRLLRLPQEDLCQALGVPSSRKYQADGGPGMGDVVALLEGSDDPAGDRHRFVQANSSSGCSAPPTGTPRTSASICTPAVASGSHPSTTSCRRSPTSMRARSDAAR
jgi:hypothetical protein